MNKELAFPAITINYLKALSRNNNKEWFNKNRERFDFEFLQPAIQLVVDLGEKLTSISPNVHAIPKIDKSIFRLHRDVRFSKNKAPFKSNLGLYFWEGRGKRMECSGYYFHLEPKLFFLGTGVYAFTKDQLKKYRELVSETGKAKELNSILLGLSKNKGFQLGGKTYKKVPRGFDPDYKFKDLLLHSGVYLFYESENLNELTKNDPAKFAFGFYKKSFSLHKWFVENLV
jgi:uncharacterized protein (TIGR02453 family)